MLYWHWLPTNLVKGSNLPRLFHVIHKRVLQVLRFLRVFTMPVGLWGNSLMKNSNPLFFGVGVGA